MGQKVHPKGFRLGVIEGWDSIWFAKRGYGDLACEDHRIRSFLKKRLYRAGISRIVIRRRATQIEVDIYTARPGLVIGKSGSEVSHVREELIGLIQKPIQINVEEEQHVETCSILVAENIALQLEKRIAFRRAMKQTITKILRAKALGVKVMIRGRLGGSEIARREWIRRGQVPLHTLRARIDYGVAEADTLFGKIGVKVWIYKGDVMPMAKETKATSEETFMHGI